MKPLLTNTAYILCAALGGTVGYLAGEAVWRSVAAILDAIGGMML